MSSIIRKSVAFEQVDIESVNEQAQRKGLGSRGFSAALRMIVREWNELKNGSGKDDRQEIDDVLSV